MPIIINKDYAKQIYVTKFDIDFVVQNILFIPNPAFRYHKRGKAYDFRIVIFFLIVQMFLKQYSGIIFLYNNSFMSC